MSRLSRSPAGVLASLDGACFIALLLLLLWAPVPLGSNRTWATSMLMMWSGGLLLLTWLLHTLGGRAPHVRCLQAWPPLLALGLFAVLVAAQAWGGVSGGLFASADPFETRRYLLLTLTYLAVFAVVVLLVNTRQRARVFVMTLVAGGVVQALLAIVLLSTNASYTVFFQSITHHAQTTGTYVSRNHLACYLYLCLSLGIGWILGSLSPSAPRISESKAMLLALLQFVLSPRMALRLLLVVMVIALVLTRSRMGNGAFLAGLLAVSVMLWWRLPSLRAKLVMIVLSLLLVDILVVGQWVGLDRVVQRLEGTALVEQDRQGEETFEARLQPAANSLALIEKKIWFGHGGGTFYTTFTPYKSSDMLLHLLYFDHAHNDYVEIAADVGLVGLFLLMSVVGLTAFRAWSLAAQPYDAAVRGLAYGVWMALCCVTLHSLVDFNLHIPANALTFSAILALTWVVPWQRQPVTA